jgi:hypothetical protein
MKRERRQLTRREQATIASKRPVVRRIRPDSSPFAHDLTKLTAHGKRGAR